MLLDEKLEDERFWDHFWSREGRPDEDFDGDETDEFWREEWF